MSALLQRMLLRREHAGNVLDSTWWWSEVWPTLVKVPQYGRLYYHNALHYKAVLDLTQMILMHSDSAGFMNYIRPLELAAVYHDANHSGNRDEWRDPQGRNNIDRAIEMLMAAPLPPGFTEEERRTAATLIRYTYAPHEQVDQLTALSADLVAAIGVLRDADMLHGLLPGLGYQSMVGIRLEKLWSGETHTLGNLLEMAEDQIRFIRNYEPHSQAAREVRDFLWDAGVRSWYEAHEAFIRQLAEGEIQCPPWIRDWPDYSALIPQATESGMSWTEALRQFLNRQTA